MREQDFYLKVLQNQITEEVKAYATGKINMILIEKSKGENQKIKDCIYELLVAFPDLGYDTQSLQYELSREEIRNYPEDQVYLCCRELEEENLIYSVLVNFNNKIVKIWYGFPNSDNEE